jgi:hypothetical protein
LLYGLCHGAEIVIHPLYPIPPYLFLEVPSKKKKNKKNKIFQKILFQLVILGSQGFHIALQKIYF